MPVPARLNSGSMSVPGWAILISQPALRSVVAVVVFEIDKTRSYQKRRIAMICAESRRANCRITAHSKTRVVEDFREKNADFSLIGTNRT
jgi:hypothetical protein